MLEIVDSGLAQYTKQQKLDDSLNMTLAHSNDQDKNAFDLARGVFAVADGVGGVPHGEKAAQTACDAFVDELEARGTGNHELLHRDRALHIAQASLAHIIHTAVVETGGLTTFTGIYRVGREHMAYLHAGDSGLLRRRANQIERITSVQHQDTSQLINYMGGVARQKTEVSIEGGLPSLSACEWGLLHIQAGDRYILATDGVTDATSRHNPNGKWWVRKSKLKLGAQALADYLVRASPRIDDAEAVVIDFGEVDERNKGVKN